MSTTDSSISDLAEWHLLRQEQSRRTLLAFTSYTFPLFAPSWHHVRLAAELDAVLEGKTKRIIVNMPPQNGKSELVSRRFPAYALGKRPNIPIIHCSYNADLATEMSRDVQQIIDGKAYRELFPGTRLAGNKDREIRMAAQFDVVGKDGSYRAAGVGQGITGKSMILGIIDDPVKSRAEAESDAYRRMVWNWYSSDFRTRSMGDDAAIVLVQTRWHEDDLAGRLLRHAQENPDADQWRVVSFPAIAEEHLEGDPRAIGDPLWPSRFSLKWLNSTRVTSGIYDWSALYQQRPVPAGGAMAQREWFTILPTAMRTGIIRRCRAWDCAATVPKAGRDPDYTVGTLVAQLHDGRYLVEDVIRARVTPHQVDKLILQTARLDGTKVQIREEEEGGSSGKSVIAAHARMLSGFDYKGVRSTGEKTTRWRPFLAQAEAGNVVVNPGSWNTEWLDEMALLPYGRHDDQGDSVALGFNELANRKDYGPMVAAILPESIPGWREQFFRH